MLHALVRNTEWGPLMDLLSPAFFDKGDGHWLWKPEPAIGLWDEELRAGCRALYEGQFGDTHAVSFSLREFQRRFHEVFKRCKETESKLHPSFLTLGLALAPLYEHLEAIGAPLDVNAAFERVHDRSRTAPAERRAQDAARGAPGSTSATDDHERLGALEGD